MHINLICRGNIEPKFTHTHIQVVVNFRLKCHSKERQKEPWRSSISKIFLRSQNCWHAITYERQKIIKWEATIEQVISSIPPDRRYSISTFNAQIFYTHVQLSSECLSLETAIIWQSKPFASLFDHRSLCLCCKSIQYSQVIRFNTSVVQISI